MTRILVAAALLALPLAADETSLVVEPTDWELLPLDDQEVARFQREHADLVRSVKERVRRLDEVAKALAGRADPVDEESARLRARALELQGELRPVLVRPTEALRGHGVDDEVLARIRATPSGPNRVSRHAHRLVREAVRTPERRVVADALVEAVDGAQLAFVARRTRSDRAAAGQGEDAATETRAALGDLEVHRREIERRFWLVVDCLLDDAEKIEVRRFLPREFDRWSDPIEHSYRLPGITPAQASRIRALAAELDSESAADRAEEKRLDERLRAKDLDPEERKKTSRALEEVRSRLLDLRLATTEAGRAVLTPEQLAAFQAIPPFVGPNDRNLRPENLLVGLRLSDEQRVALAGLRRELEEGRRAYERELAEIRKLGAETSPEAPQERMMEMMTMALQGEGQAAMRALARRLHVEVLSPEQVADWVLGLDETLVPEGGLGRR